MPNTPSALYQGEFYKSRQARTTYAAEEMLGLVQSYFKFDSIVDFGCGVGTWLNVAKEMGVSTLRGYEGEWVKPHLDDSNIDIRFKNFETPIEDDEKFDLAISLEVAEHLTPEAGKALVKSMCAASNLVMFGAAIPGQDGVGHINEQPQEYWQNIFADLGFQPVDIVRPAIWNNTNIPLWYKQNTLLYTSDKKLHDKLVKNVKPIINAVHPEAYDIALNPGLRASLKAAFSIPKLILKRLFTS